jgi:hypothetical protein
VLAGLAAGHLATHLIGWISWDGRSLPLSGLWLSAQEPLLVTGVFALALLAVALPVWRVMRLDVTLLLQAPR